jgi:signal transduction histidine kinase
VSDTHGSASDRRVLVQVPTSRDASMVQVVLSQAHIPHEICPAFGTLLHELGLGAAAVLLPEEVITPTNITLLCEVLASQPPWSDLPVLVLTRPGADSDQSGRATQTLGNVTLLERPLRVATLLSAIRTALRARDRQYELREHLAQRERAEQALREADRRKDEFLAMLGHELRNPLAPLMTGLQLLKLADMRDDPVVLRVRGVMERQVHHLARLVDDLLEVSRITRGLIQLRREPLDLILVLRSAIETCRPAVETAQHELIVDLPTDPVTVTGDAVRLTQVFANLLSNAAKYTDAGGHIRVTARREADRVLVSVRDDGIGIPATHLTSVFEMFSQVDRWHRRTQGGLGIGLTLVRTLVTMHGGRVEARSQGLGAGSEFVVDLPLLVGATAEAETTGPPRKFPARRILVVDDNLDAGEMLRALLTALGATAAKAHSGRVALEVLDSFKPDTVLLDIGMPEMDGYEVARRIRAMPAHRGMLLVAVTGWGQEHDHRRSLEAGFDHHFVKPLDVDKLGDLLKAGRG